MSNLIKFPGKKKKHQNHHTTYAVVHILASLASVQCSGQRSRMTVRIGGKNVKKERNGRGWLCVHVESHSLCNAYIFSSLCPSLPLFTFSPHHSFFPTNLVFHRVQSPPFTTLGCNAKNRVRCAEPLMYLP